MPSTRRDQFSHTHVITSVCAVRRPLATIWHRRTWTRCTRSSAAAWLRRGNGISESTCLFAYTLVLINCLCRCMFVLSSKLSEDGWLDELKDYSKEKARSIENLAFQPLLADVLAYAESENFVLGEFVHERLTLVRCCSSTYRKGDQDSYSTISRTTIRMSVT